MSLSLYDAHVVLAEGLPGKSAVWHLTLNTTASRHHDSVRAGSEGIHGLTTRKPREEWRAGCKEKLSVRNSRGKWPRKGPGVSLAVGNLHLPLSYRVALSPPTMVCGRCLMPILQKG